MALRGTDRWWREQQARTGGSASADTVQAAAAVTSGLPSGSSTGTAGEWFLDPYYEAGQATLPPPEEEEAPLTARVLGNDPNWFLDPWWQQHAADYGESYDTDSGWWPMPSWAAAAGFNDPRSLAMAFGGYSNPAATAAGFAAAESAVGRSRADAERGIGILGEAEDIWSTGWQSAQNAALRTRKAGLEDYLGSDAARQLAIYSDPSYQAMSDEFVGTQRNLASRGIAQEQGRAINKALQVTGAYGGAEGGGLSTGLQLAARMRGAGDVAGINAQMKSDQLQFNQDFRRWATGQMSIRDEIAGGFNRDIAEIAGRIQPASPFAAQMASIVAGQDVLLLDPQAPAMSSDEETAIGPWNEALDILQITAEEALAALEAMRLGTEEDLENEEDIAERDRLIDLGTTLLGLLHVVLPP